MSYRTIISVVDEHTASTVTARYAISLALACKAELVLYAAHEKGCSDASVHHTDRHLEHSDALAAALQVSATRIVEAGDITTLLPKRVATEHADLVLYPLTPYRQFGVDLQRPALQSLQRTIKTDLAIMRVISMAKSHPGHILVPLGKTISNSDRRLVFITALAKSFHAQVTLFHLFAERSSRELPAVISRFREQLEEQRIAILERSSVGDIGKTIRVEAITRRNDLIVLGASERGVLQRLLQGNPVGDVMLHPPCNIIIFRGAVP